MGRHGGGAFSGKDPSKVDRSACYYARYVAKNVVASGLAARCEVQVAYAIGVAQPVGVHVNTFGTGKVERREAREVHPRRTSTCARRRSSTSSTCSRPIYKPTAAYGHFGRSEFSWEKTDRAAKMADDLLRGKLASKSNDNGNGSNGNGHGTKRPAPAKKPSRRAFVAEA